VRSSIADRGFLVDVFVNLFEVRSMEAAVRADLAELGVERSSLDTAEGRDFRVEIARWLDAVAR
jgi:hypothetical protein